MKTKTVLVEKDRPYSKAELAKIEKVLKKVKESRKDPEFRKAVSRFIKLTT